jgi:putative transcriptional regulator
MLALMKRGWRFEIPLVWSAKTEEIPIQNFALCFTQWCMIGSSPSFIHHEKIGRVLLQHGLPDLLREEGIMSKISDTKIRVKGSAVDLEPRPMTDAEWATAPRVARVAIIRRALELSQEQFSSRYHIPIGTLRDWEQGRKEPDAAAKAYLRVIACEPEKTAAALA